MVANCIFAHLSDSRNTVFSIYNFGYTKGGLAKKSKTAFECDILTNY